MSVTHRNLQHGVTGLEAVGPLLPHIAIFLQRSNVAPHSVPGLCDQEVADPVLCCQRLASHQAGQPAPHDDRVIDLA
eukprot:1142074-Pelagomonas_calceolata.AAC.5